MPVGTTHRHLGVLGLLLALVGCAPTVEPVYSLREEVTKLPTKHQHQIEQALLAYYGTPHFPRLMLPAPESEQPAEAKEPVLKDTLARRHLQHGQWVYTKQCAGCHGVTGDGKGPAAAYLNPPPRDYRLGKFKFISGPRGAKPRRDDLVRIIQRGAKGTSMPSFRWMSEEDLNAVIDYVKVLSSRGEMEFRVAKDAEQELSEEDDLDLNSVAEVAQTVHESWEEAADKLIRPLTPEPARTPESVELGAKAFVQLNCYKCHGRDGQGNKTQDVGKDDWGRVVYAADLTTGMLHGGRRPVDIYRRIYAGINGTPMPAFAQPDSARGETELQRSETIWHMVHFITDIVERKPLPVAVIDAAVVEQMKNSPDAAASATEAKPTEEAKPAVEKPAAEATEDKKTEDKPAAPSVESKDESPSPEAKPAPSSDEKKPTSDETKPKEQPATTKE